MTVELEVRVFTPFPLSALLHRTTELARTVLTQVPIAMIGPTADYVRDGAAATVPPELLAATCGPDGPQPAPVSIAAGDGIVEAACLDHGHPEDPELGVWMTVSAGVLRGPASRLLAALTSTAAAQLGQAEVVDDYGLLGHRRLNPPDPSPTPSATPPAPHHRTRRHRRVRGGRTRRTRRRSRRTHLNHGRRIVGRDTLGPSRRSRTYGARGFVAHGRAWAVGARLARGPSGCVDHERSTAARRHRRSP